MAAAAAAALAAAASAIAGMEKASAKNNATGRRRDHDWGEAIIFLWRHRRLQKFSTQSREKRTLEYT